MVNILEIFLPWILMNMALAYDPFQGLFQQGEPCFEAVHDEGCNTQLSQIFSPPFKGVNINAMNTQLWLFTSTNPEKAEPLHKCGGKLPDATTFDPTLDTIVISHGWLDGMCRTAWMREMKDQLFIRGKYNVILVDWTWGNTIDPIAASLDAIVAGEDVAFVILNIMEQTCMDNGDTIHFIGHSFGSFVMNVAGRYIVKNNPQKIVGRITALDPPIAPYRNDNPKLLLNVENTKFMDVIHGDGGNCFPITLGILTPIGHIDFYPNGGSYQSSCYTYILPLFEKGDFLYALGSVLFPPLCSHLQAIQYFKVSITHPQGFFIGAQCKNYEEFLLGKCKRCCKEDFSRCAIMGMDARKYFQHYGQPRKNRTYYLNLGLDCPYNEDYEFSIYRNC